MAAGACPPRHLQRLNEELLPCLAWPTDDSDVESWRKAWWEAFKLPGRPDDQGLDPPGRPHGPNRPATCAPRYAKRLAKRTGRGPFSALMEQIRTQLVSDVNADSFADMCAQTLVYGMLSSRVTNPKDSGRRRSSQRCRWPTRSWRRCSSRSTTRPCRSICPAATCRSSSPTCAQTNVEAILDQIDSTIKGGDPVIHFYEEFLKQYDRKMRADAGAFYTPQPAVEFIVRAVDEVLRTRFGLQMGIADAASWQEVAERQGFEVPEGVHPDKPFVSMVDPATGTGTFLVEWLRRARKSFLDSGAPGEWPEHPARPPAAIHARLRADARPLRHRPPQGRPRTAPCRGGRRSHADPPHRHAGAHRPPRPVRHHQ